MSDLHPYVLLDEIANFANGKALPKSKYDENGLFPVYGSNGIIAYSDEKRYDDGVTVIGRVGAYCGSLYFSNGPAWVTDNAIVTTGKNGVDSRFLYYLFQTLQLNRTAIGSTQPLLTQSGLKVIKARFPPIEKRSDIQTILSALDDKIENNRQMNETLEEIARALFRDWFVDFGPTRRQMDGATDPCAIMGHAFPPEKTATLAPLFPSSFDDDGLPMGWATGKIEDIVDRQRAGKLFSKKTVHEEGTVPVLDQSAADIIGFHNEDPSVLSSPSDRVITFANHTCVLRLIDFNFSAIQNVIPFKGKIYPTEWVLFASHNKQKFEEYKGHWPTFMIQPVIMPDDDTSSAFAKIVEPIVSKISANLSQNKTLAELRDLLLPKLMSGEINIRDAEALV